MLKSGSCGSNESGCFYIYYRDIGAGLLRPHPYRPRYAEVQALP